MPETTGYELPEGINQFRRTIEFAGDTPIYQEDSGGWLRAGDLPAVAEVIAQDAVEREREKLANGGDLPAALEVVGPNSNLGILIRAALSVAEEDAVERFCERLLGDEALETAELAEGAVWETEMQNGEATPEKSRRMTRAGIQAAIDHARKEGQDG